MVKCKHANILHVPVQSREPIIRLLSCVAVYHTDISFVLFYINQIFSFLLFFLHLFRFFFYSRQSDMGIANCLRSYGHLWLQTSMSFGL